MQRVSILKKNIDAISKKLKELDHQAKLIIKSDMELKLYQEELEDKLNKLTLLKNLILSSIHILDKEQLFSQINEKTVNDLGFRKGLILDFNDLAVKVNVGVELSQIEKIKKFFHIRKEILKTNPIITATSEICKELIPPLYSKNFLITPIKARGDIYGIFILSDPLMPTEIKRAEKEVSSIISMYLGQCLDNIKLFEDLYRSKDYLEKKIKERTNELVKSLREIESVNKMKSDFISSVSHELRTPLTSIKGFSSLLVDEHFGKLPPQAKERLEKVDSNVNKLVEMVNALLDISRIESGKTEVKIAPADIVKLIKEVGDFLSPQMKSKEIEFITDTPASLIVYMDRNLIERVFINLINNSIKFTPPKGKIIVKCTVKDKKALIAITDTGCGIPKDDLDKIFQEFYRVPSTHVIQGSGLGLSLVKRIIDIHKEKIEVESEVGKGTTFYFTLRLVENV
jgi:signal transduction histidine kinase